MTQTNMNEDCNLDTIKVSITDLAELRDLFEFDDDMSEAISSPEYVIPFVSKKILELQAHVNQLREALKLAKLTLIEKECKANWESSTMKARWYFFGGCQVEVKPNKWIPAKNYREEE